MSEDEDLSSMSALSQTKENPARKSSSEEIVNSVEVDNTDDISTLEESEYNNSIIEGSKERSEKIDNPVEFDNDISDAISEKGVNVNNSSQTRSSKINPLSFEQEYICNIGDTIPINAVFTSKELVKESSMTCNDSSAVSIGAISNVTLSDISCCFSALVTPSKTGVYTLTLSLTTDENVYTASTKLTVIDSYKEEYFTGILKNVDTSTRRLFIDDLIYDPTNECDLSNASNVMKNSDSKKVVYSTVGGKVDKICSIYDVLTPSITINATPDPFMYQNGSYNQYSIPVEVKIECSRSSTSTFSLPALDSIEGLSLSLKKLELKLKSNLLNFGSTDSIFIINKTTESEEGIEVPYRGAYESSFMVYPNASKVPSKVSTQVEIESKVTVDGKSKSITCKPIYITVGNLDKQQEKAKKKSETLKYGQFINEATGTLKGMSNAFQFDDKYFSNEQEKAINEFVNVWMSELILAKYIDKSDFRSKISKKVSDKLLNKLGFDKNIATIPNTIIATTYLETQTSDKTKVFIQFDVNLLCMEFGKDGFPTMASGSGKATIYDTKGIEIGSSAILPAYANICAFTKQLQEVAKSTIFNGTRIIEKIFVDDEKIAEALSSKTMGKILNACYEKKVFNMTTSKDLKKACDKLFEKGIKTCNDKILKLTMNSSIDHIQKVNISCPVDVNIYDGDGNLCGIVSDNTVDSTYDDVIVNINNGDQKNIYFTEDDYSFELVGTDEDSMNYKVSEIDNTGNVVREIMYENVKLTDGCTYYSYVSEAGNYSSKLFDLVDSEGNTLSPTTGADEEPVDNIDEPIASGQCGDDVYWKIFSDGLMYVYGNGEMYNYDMDNLPEWRSVAMSMYGTYLHSVNSLLIGYGITSIGSYNFYNLPGLEKIELPDSLVYIGDNAFNCCFELYNVSLPNSITVLGESAFENCEKLKNINLSDSLSSIGNYAFHKCTALSDIVLPDGLISIGDGAFSHCYQLKSINLPDSLTSICYGAFSICENLNTIVIPNSITSINDWTFNSCRNLSDITLPDGLISIGDNAFSDCTGLSSIKIPDSVTSIGDNTFKGCVKLNDISFIQNLVSIGESTFSECKSITSVEIPDNWTFISDGLFSGCTGLSSIEIPDSVTSIGNGVFYKCGLENITLPDSVTSIGDNAFSECKSLSKITLSDSLTSIGRLAFYECGLENITFPDSVTSIGYLAFRGCEKLVKITILNKLCEISDYEDTFPVNATIYGYVNSSAQRYAKNYRRKFIVIDKESSESPIPSVTAIPTDTPIEIPSIIPTDTPTAIPSAIPTDTPINTPVTMPSVIPTEIPDPTVPSTPTVTATPSLTPVPVPGASDAIKKIETNVVNGEASVSVSEDDMDSLMQGAVSSDQTTLILKVVGTDGADKVTVEIPKRSLSDIASKAGVSLDVATVLGTISLNKQVLDAVVNTVQTDFVRLVMEKQQVDAAYKDMFGANASVTKMFFLSGDMKITAIGTDKMRISLPVTDALQERDLAVTYADADGKWVKLSGKYVTTDKDYYQFETPVLGNFVLAEGIAVDTFIQDQDKRATQTTTPQPKMAQNITNRYTGKIKKQVGSKLTQKVTGAKTKVTFSSSDPEVAKVGETNGVITCTGVGKAVITSKAASTELYKAASKKITIYVLPKTVKVDSIQSRKKGQVTVKINVAAKENDGYQFQYKHNGKTKKIKVTSQKAATKTFKKLKSGKAFKVRVRAYRKVGKKTYYGNYSKWKTLKVVK
ncbi:MAG: leucine-rich repeat protein [Lachnospiraceae bacterium]|nr:leucine-rich repeat protein [Lachnospiraceae bacterium]